MVVCVFTRITLQYHNNYSFSFKLRFLPPTNKVCKGYVFTRVCQSFCSQGDQAHCMLGYTPHWTRGRHPPQTRHPPGPDTPLTRHPPPRADTPGSRHPPGADTPRTVHAGRYGQQVGGMHPTGMQSCCKLFISAIIVHQGSFGCWCLSRKSPMLWHEFFLCCYLIRFKFNWFD